MTPYDIVAPGLRLGLGEAPWWDGQDGSLLCVDVARRAVHRIHADASVTTLHLDVHLSAAIPTTGGGLAMTTSSGLLGIDAAGRRRQLVAMNADSDPTWRMNDAKCDGHGRLWSSTFRTDFAPGGSTLLRLTGSEGAGTVLTGLQLANGLDWSPDGATLYVVDSRAYTVLALPYDTERGTIGAAQPLIELDPALGFPDGLSVSADGRIWLAMYQGATVRSFGPDGSADKVLRVPVTRVTSVCFGGESLADLYVTTARTGLGVPDRAASPEAGAVFVFRDLAQGAPGRPLDLTTLPEPDQEG